MNLDTDKNQLQFLCRLLLNKTTDIYIIITTNKNDVTRIDWGELNVKLQEICILDQKVKTLVSNNEHFNTWSIRYFLRLWKILYFQFKKIHTEKAITNTWLEFDHIRFSKQYQYALFDIVSRNDR